MLSHDRVTVSVNNSASVYANCVTVYMFILLINMILYLCFLIVMLHFSVRTCVDRICMIFFDFEVLSVTITKPRFILAFLLNSTSVIEWIRVRGLSTSWDNAS